jgi:sterol desaturase/sphingolipid hydroxylase (fatty acid hydroxylase superfamily)
MTDLLSTSETTIRLGCFLGFFIAIAILEALWPRRSRSLSRWQRWPSNLGIIISNTVLLRIVIPTSAVALAILADTNHWGLLNQLSIAPWFIFIFALLLLDLAIYLQHVLFHSVPVLWRLHRMHHADLDLDVTSGLRFHPVEMLLSTAIKLAAVAALGPPASAVLLFEIALNATAMFNHGNLRIPVAADRMLRWLVVTPDMHRVHHSFVPQETNSNFGFNLPWWDRLFRTYRAQPAAGHEEMIIGIDQFREPADLRLDRMLMQPFK